ncbi:TPA: hypothetical protein DIU22_01525 [Candidatus Woesebacteria bacterium]|nr:hypothetical protein [Candidatus Woesebacteria bacterium]
MILILFSFLIIFLFIFYFLRRGFSILEALGLSAIILLGVSGIVPFIGNEFFNISYIYSSIEIFTVVFAISSISMLFLRHNNRKKINYKISKIDFLMLVLVSFILIRGFLLPMRGWDAFSLYDSRALMFLSGTKLSDMIAFSKYDEFNQLYYFSYPPMTSVLHTVLYSGGPTNTMIIYAIFYSVFIIFAYLFIRGMKINGILKFFLFVISVLNPLIFMHTKLAYTNLPTLTFQFVSLYYLIKYGKSYKGLYLLISALFLGFSNWTRSLEPLFISFFIAFAFLILKRKNSLIDKVIEGAKYLFVSMATWLIWSLYIRFTIGGLGDTSPSLLEMISKISSSLLLSNLLDVVFFVYSALSRIGLYILMTLFIFLFVWLRTKKSIKTEEKIVMIIIFTTEALMIGGTLYFSKTFSWWNQIPDSFLRSNLIMIPLTGILSGYFLEDLKTRK